MSRSDHLLNLDRTLGVVIRAFTHTTLTLIPAQRIHTGKRVHHRHHHHHHRRRHHHWCCPTSHYCSHCPSASTPPGLCAVRYGTVRCAFHAGYTVRVPTRMTGAVTAVEELYCTRCRCRHRCRRPSRELSVAICRAPCLSGVTDRAAPSNVRGRGGDGPTSPSTKHAGPVARAGRGAARPARTASL